MPHVSIKCYPGKTVEEKERLAKKILDDIVEVFEVEEDGVSISIQDVEKEKWEKEVWEKEIIGKEDILYKKPGYQF